VIERNPMWAPIAHTPADVAEPTPRKPTLTYTHVVNAYRTAPSPVRLSMSQRYSLVVTEPLPPMVQR
jgi:hypothetical protein